MPELTQTFDILAGLVVVIVAIGALWSRPALRDPSKTIATAIFAASAVYLAARVLPVWGLA
jgi:hypothetical protein